MRTILSILLLLTFVLNAQEENKLKKEIKKTFKFSTFYAAVNGGTSISDVDVELYNIVGELIEINNIKRIDLSDYPDGIYNLIITYDKIRITKKIIKL